MTPVKESTPRRKPNKKAPKTGLFYSKPVTTPLFYQRLIGNPKSGRGFSLRRDGHCLFGRGFRKEGQGRGQNHEACRDGISNAVIACAVRDPSRQNRSEDTADAVGREENPIIQSKILRPPVVRAGGWEEGEAGTVANPDDGRPGDKSHDR